MTLTGPQLATLKAAILANPTWAALPNTSDGNFDLAVLLNQPAVPAFFIWRSKVTVDEIMTNGFDWTRVDNLTVGKARIWDWMTQLGTINPSQANVRAGVEACFSVQAGDQPNRQAIYDHAQRLATAVEKIFAMGTGATSNDHGVGPGTVAPELEGPINPQLVGQARNS